MGLSASVCSVKIKKEQKLCSQGGWTLNQSVVPADDASRLINAKKKSSSSNKLDLNYEQIHWITEQLEHFHRKRTVRLRGGGSDGARRPVHSEAVHAGVFWVAPVG